MRLANLPVVVVVVVLLSLLLRLAHAAGPACYGPGGQNMNGRRNQPDRFFYEPCVPSAEQSMCCGIGPGRISLNNSDECLPSGFCRATNGDLWRLSCTDPSWVSNSCLKLFLNGTGFDGGPVTVPRGDPDQQVTLCDDGSWCYGSNNSACCIAGEGVWLDENGNQVSVKPVSSSSATAAAVPSGNPSTDPKQNNAGNGLSTGAKAGLGLGIAASVLLLIIAGMLFYRTFSKKKQVTAQRPDAEVVEAHGSTPMAIPGQSPTCYPGLFHELKADHYYQPSAPPAELDNQSNRRPQTPVELGPRD